MPQGLKRFHRTGSLHFITWSCFKRQPLLAAPEGRDLLLQVLEQMRNRYRFAVVGFVVMPEHVHLIMSEPLIASVAGAIAAVKLGFTRRVPSEKSHLWQNRPEMGHPRSSGEENGFIGRHFWTKRYYDFNLWSQRKEAEKLHYMHQNPVVRGLVERPEQWRWSSFNYYASRETGIVTLNDWTWWEKRIQSKAG